jgi:hypothetical protein
LTAGEAKNVDNAVVLARLFNEASGQKAPSKKHGLFISRPLALVELCMKKKSTVNRKKFKVLFFDLFILRIDDSVIGMNNAGLALS